MVCLSRKVAWFVSIRHVALPVPRQKCYTHSSWFALNPRRCVILSNSPRVCQLTPDEGRALCGHYQLPPPLRVQPVSKTWTHVNFGLYFNPAAGIGDLMLRRVVCEPGWDTLHREFSALSLAQKAALPIVDRYQILPDGLISGRAALSRLLPGQPVTTFKDHPGFLPLCEQVGRAMGILADQKQPHFGSSPSGASLLPTAPTWKKEWMRWANQWLLWARKTGELVPGRTALEAMLRDRVDALDEVSDFTLVHGDLHSGNFLATEEGEQLTLSGLIDWDRAMAGDHLVDWSIIIPAPSEALAAIVRGYGPDRVRAFLEPGPLARLEAYYLTHTLARIGVVTSDLFRVDGGNIAAFALTLAAKHVEDALEPGTVRRRLEEALQSDDAARTKGGQEPPGQNSNARVPCIRRGPLYQR